MAIDDPLEVACVGSESDSLYPAVEHDIVKKNVANAIEGDTDGYRCDNKLSGYITEQKEHNCDATEEHSKEIVFLKSRVARFMMIFM